MTEFSKDGFKAEDGSVMREDEHRPPRSSNELTPQSKASWADKGHVSLDLTWFVDRHKEIKTKLDSTQAELSKQKKQLDALDANARKYHQICDDQNRKLDRILNAHEESRDRDERVQELEKENKQLKANNEEMRQKKVDAESRCNALIKSGCPDFILHQKELHDIWDEISHCKTNEDKRFKAALMSLDAIAGSGNRDELVAAVFDVGKFLWLRLNNHNRVDEKIEEKPSLWRDAIQKEFEGWLTIYQPSVGELRDDNRVKSKPTRDPVHKVLGWCVMEDGNVKKKAPVE